MDGWNNLKVAVFSQQFVKQSESDLTPWMGVKKKNLNSPYPLGNELVENVMMKEQLRQCSRPVANAIMAALIVEMHQSQGCLWWAHTFLIHTAVCRTFQRPCQKTHQPLQLLTSHCCCATTAADGCGAFVYIQHICRSGTPRLPGCHGNWVSNMTAISRRNRL